MPRSRHASVLTNLCGWLSRSGVRPHGIFASMHCTRHTSLFEPLCSSSPSDNSTSSSSSSSAILADLRERFGTSLSQCFKRDLSVILDSCNLLPSHEERMCAHTRPGKKCTAASGGPDRRGDCAAASAPGGRRKRRQLQASRRMLLPQLGIGGG